MIPRLKKNRKAQSNTLCPNCGMDLADRKTEGFVANGETFCCRGCAEGTGCTCLKPRFVIPKSGQRRGSLGQRNANHGTAPTPSSAAKSRKTNRSRTPSKRPSRGDLLADGRKNARSKSEERPSTRRRARGQADATTRVSGRKR